MVRDNRDAHLDTIAKAFKWTRDDAREELAKVHLSNLPENLAFFSGAIDAAGSFGGIYQSAVLAYGSDLIKDPPDAERFASLAALKAIEGTGQFKDQKVAISPIRTGGPGTLESEPAALEGHPLPVRAELGDARPRQPVEPVEPRRDQEDAAGEPGLDHPAARPRRQRAWSRSSASSGGEAFVRTQALKAMELSKKRAAEIRQMLITRLTRRRRSASKCVGRGWEEPVVVELRREPPRRSAVVHDRVAA